MFLQSGRRKGTFKTRENLGQRWYRKTNKKVFNHHRKPWVCFRKLSLQPMVQRCYIRLFKFKICMNHINQSNFIRAKFTWRTRNWRATRILTHNFFGLEEATEVMHIRTSQGGPTGDERGNRWESPVGYRRWCLIRLKSWRRWDLTLLVGFFSQHYWDVKDGRFSRNPLLITIRKFTLCKNTINCLSFPMSWDVLMVHISL